MNYGVIWRRARIHKSEEALCAIYHFRGEGLRVKGVGNVCQSLADATQTAPTSRMRPAVTMQISKLFLIRSQKPQSD